jgi:hypothetical protein
MSSNAHDFPVARSEKALPLIEDQGCRARLYGSVRCAWFASLFFAGLAAAEGTLRGPLTAWAIGLPNGYIVMEHQAQVVHVTAEDALRGTVEVRGGSRLIVITHASSRYAFDFSNRSTIFRPVGIKGVSIVKLGPGGATARLQHPAGRRAVDLDYKFELAPGTRPGVYPWPLTFTVRGGSREDTREGAVKDRGVMLSGPAER